MKLSLAGLALLPSMAHAQLVVPTSTTRLVWSTSDGASADDSFADVDFDTEDGLAGFVAVASTTFVPVGIGGGGAEQDSFLEADRLVATGSCYASAEVLPSGWSGGATGTSAIEFDFTLTDKAAYVLVGSIAAFDLGGCQVEIQSLDDPFLSVGDKAQGPSQIVSVGHAGILPAGDYRFTILADAAGVLAPGLQFASAEFDLSLVFRPMVQSVCATSPNSVGPGALLGALGSTSIAANDLVLTSAGGPPGVPGLLFRGTALAQVPFGDGLRCVGGVTQRLHPPVFHDAGGNVAVPVDLQGGVAFPGGSWYAQLWYRDPAGPGGSGFNTSDALRVTFCQ